MAERLEFDILARDNASRAFRDVGNEALKASGKVDIAAASLAAFDETARKAVKADNTLADARKASARADALYADAQNVLGGRMTKTTRLMSDQRREAELGVHRIENLGVAAENAGKASSVMGSGMAYAVGAAVALSPIIATVGTGLAGLGLAAYGVLKPITKAAQATGGLKANLAGLDPEQRAVARSILGLQASYDQFQKSLKPVVLQDFNAAIATARPLLREIEPVAASTGKALASVLTSLGRDFQSAEWKQFFTWMAQNAGPDLRQLGTAFISLANAIPPILEDLHPLAQGLLGVTQVAGQAAQAVGNLAHAHYTYNAAATDTNNRNGILSQGWHWLLRIMHDTSVAAIPGVTKSMQQASRQAGSMGSQLRNTGKDAQGTTVRVQGLTNQVITLTTALAGLSSGLLTTEQDQVAWKQAQQAADTALKKVTGSLDSNKIASLAARAAIISSTQAALTYANQEVSVHHNTAAATTIIQDQIKWLQDHAAHSKIAAQEIDALRAALAKLQNKRVTVTLTTAGGGTVKVTSSVKNAAGFLEFHKAGYRVPGYGGGDTYGPVMVEPGETIVPKHLTPAVAPLMRANRVPGFASGGLVGELGTLVPFASGRERPFAIAEERTFGTAVVNALIQHAQMVENAAKIKAINAYGGGPVGGGAAAAQAYARSRLGSFGWPPGEMSYLIPLWNRESGWNRFAENPSSHAYGIPQALPFTKMPKAAWPAYAGGQSSMGAQVNWGMSYIKGRYGTPAGAWGHEVRYGWYDRGGMLPPGLTMAWNGTGRPEPVGFAAGARGGGQRITLELRSSGAPVDEALLQLLRRSIRVRGGNVQFVLGH